jgi:hypothetical protein
VTRATESDDDARVDNEVDESALDEFVKRTDLTGLKIVKWSGCLHGDAPFRVQKIRLETGISFRIAASSVDCKYAVRATLHGETPEESGELDVTVVASFSVAGEGRASNRLVRSFVEQVGYFVSFPFIRESLQTMSVRLGLDPLTLGLLRQEYGGIPATVSFTTDRPSKLTVAE